MLQDSGELSRRDVLRLMPGAAAATLGVAGWSDRAAAQDKNSLIFIGWGGSTQDYQREAFLKPFEKTTGIKVIETTLPTLPKMKTMVEARNVEVDVADESGFVMVALANLGYLEPIDYEAVANEDVNNLLDQAKKKYAIGNYTISLGLGYRTDTFPGRSHPKTWREFWDVAKFPGRRALAGGTRGLRPQLEVALLADGVPPDRLYPIDEERAWKSLARIKPHIVKWWVDSGLPPQLLANREVALTSAFNGRIDAVKREGQPIDFEFNEGEFRLSYWVVPKGAPHRENAMRLIAFCMRPDRQAHFASLISYGPTNRAAFRHISADRAKELPSSPENMKKQWFHNEEWWAENAEKVFARWNSWILE